MLIPLKSYLKEWLGAAAGLVGIDLIIYGVIIMLISAFEPRGIWGIVEKIRGRRRRRLMALLEVHELIKAFGGLRPTTTSPSCWRGRTAGAHRPQRRRQDHALQLHRRHFPPTSGRIVFDGQDITASWPTRSPAGAWPAPSRSTRPPGISRWLENVMVGCFMHTRSRASAQGHGTGRILRGSGAAGIFGEPW